MATSWEIKLGRFNKHLDDVKRAAANYLAEKPYVLTKQEDAERLRKTWTITLTKPVPDGIPAMLGDALHNLRSVLDNWVFELSTSPEGVTKSKTGFPVLANESEWGPGSCCRNDHGAHRIRGLPDPMKAVVEMYQPFNSDNVLGDNVRYNLRTLHLLDIRDKHQTLNVVAANVDMGWWTVADPSIQQIGRFVLKGLLELNTPTTFLVLDFPTRRDFEVSVEPYPMMEVVVAEERTQRWEQPGEEIGSFLDALYNSVTWIIGSAHQAVQPPLIPEPPGAE
jgi:hypothetical protein